MLGLNFVLLLCGVSTTFALYSDNDNVVELTSSNFKDKVLASDELWFVEFYAPWCGHCKNLAPEWKKAANNLKGIASVGAVDMTAHQQVGAPYGIQGYPTIKIFGANKNKPKDYGGGRDASSITKEAMNAVRDMVDENSRGGSKSSGQGSGRSGSSGGGGGANEVVTLTDSNFKELVMDGDETWLVEFYAPWCGHCKSLEPEWRKAASRVKAESGGKVKLGALDATVHTATASRYGVRGYPTIKIFQSGSKEEAQNYEGGRDEGSIVAVAMTYFEIDPPTVDELISQEVFDEKCKDHMCVVAFLQDLQDSGKDGRNDYIEILQAVGDTLKKHQWGWMWVQGGVLPEFEQNVKVGGSGYPTLIVVNTRKQLFTPYMGAFEKTTMTKELRVLTYGRVRNTHELPELPRIPDREPWDGKDAPVVEYEEEDLSDFKWDDEL